jgi:hypothetical protein
MRLGLLREFKNLRKFFDSMEAGVKSRDPAKIYPAYAFMQTLVRHMNEGDLTPISIELHQELTYFFENNLDINIGDRDEVSTEDEVREVQEGN